MKIKTILLLFLFFLMLPLFGVNYQEQEHQHKHKGLELYERQRIRYEDRFYWQMPNRVLDELNITPGMTIADVGAGIGYFTFILAKKVGEKGKVYASDIDKDALAILNERRKKEGLENISIIHGQEDNPLIPKVSVDLVLIVNTIQFVKEKTTFLNNIRSSLKENGKLVFIQWDAEKLGKELRDWDKKDREKYTMHTMLNMIYAANYEVLEIKDFLPMQLIYICQPKGIN